MFSLFTVFVDYLLVSYTITGLCFMLLVTFVTKEKHMHQDLVGITQTSIIIQSVL